MAISVNIESVVIIGSGPAAFSAAIYTSRHRPLILAGDYSSSSQHPGGQLMTTTGVDNYPGFPEGIEGPQLVEVFKAHAEKHARVEELWVKSVSKENDCFLLSTSEGVIRSKGVIVATGSVARKLDTLGVSDFWQKGISACATCDGWLFTDKVVVVIGGGDTAMEEVQYLSLIAKKVVLVHRSETFRARPDLLSKIRGLENVEILPWSVLVEAVGGKTLENVMVKDVRTGEIAKITAEGLFFAIGHDPSTSFLESLQQETGKPILLDGGYIGANKESMQTAVEGLFAAGDVQDHKYRQAITAAYTGMLAGQSLSSWLDSKK
ncbi:thioredoxin reductase (NADPH) [Nematocida major]|uniref:thioredoxin reductase (NADPH) n=1 Tax=Nematocida major TaxID=1912982 RepID=UPI002008D0AE|nr:thioredoxin reductase (NADPH) [Nematocida major]KAH9386622.1 thioredoxin reductase (NADPH) [Nematocida major]